MQVDTVVDGKPCIARLTSYEPGSSMVVTGTGFGDAIAPDPEVVEFELLHVSGSPWPELEKGLSQTQASRIRTRLVEMLLAE